MNKSIWLIFLFAGFLVIFSSCKKKNDGHHADVPKEFTSMSDRERVNYLVDNVTPDSVARFLVDASLGDIEGVKIDTLIIAQGAAYEKYENQPDEMAIFSSELERYAASLDLTRKKKLYAMSGMHDPEGFGYDLGLEYVNNIREKKLNLKDVTEEITEFRNSCTGSLATYNRFVKGFKIALQLDHVGVPADVYQRFMMLEEIPVPASSNTIAGDTGNNP